LPPAAGAVGAAGGRTNPAGTSSPCDRRVTVEHPVGDNFAEGCAPPSLPDTTTGIAFWPVIEPKVSPRNCGRNRRTPGAKSDHFVRPDARRDLCFLADSHRRTDLSDRTRHDVRLLLVLPTWLLEMMNLVVELFLRASCPWSEPHGVTGWRPPGVSAFTATVRWRFGFHRDTRCAGAAPPPLATLCRSKRHIVGVGNRADVAMQRP